MLLGIPPWIPPNEPGCAEAQTEGSRDIKSAPCAALPLSDSHSMVDRHKTRIAKRSRERPQERQYC